MFGRFTHITHITKLEAVVFRQDDHDAYYTFWNSFNLIYNRSPRKHVTHYKEEGGVSHSKSVRRQCHNYNVNVIKSARATGLAATKGFEVSTWCGAAAVCNCVHSWRGALQMQRRFSGMNKDDFYCQEMAAAIYHLCDGAVYHLCDGADKEMAVKKLICCM